MNRSKKRILIVGVASLMLLPAAAHADIVFDPTNFVEAVLQVESDIQMVDNLYQEVTNDVAMVKGWNFTQLPGLLQNMDVWQQVFGQAGTTYSSTDPASALNTMFPSDLTNFANTTDTAIASMRSGWDQEERSVLVENRTVQNQTYLNLQPTAQRIQHIPIPRPAPPPPCRPAMRRRRHSLRSSRLSNPRKSPTVAPRLKRPRRRRRNKPTPRPSSRPCAATGAVPSSPAPHW